MKSLLLFGFLSTWLWGTGQVQITAIPVLPQKGKSIVNFVPKGWLVFDTASGDLNRDGKMDKAFILESKDSLTDYRYDGETIYPQIVRSKARILAIAFLDSISNDYVIISQENEFILRADEGNCMGDPWNGFKIEKGSLYLNFWGGCSDKWNVSYQFVYRSKQLQLIGATHVGYDTSLGGETWSFNFLTSKAKQTILHANNKLKDKVKWHTLKLSALKTLETLKRPFNWQVFPNVFL